MTFEGRIEPLVWGNSTYTIVRLPEHIAVSLQNAGAKRVEGEMAEHPVSLALSHGPEVDGVFLWAGQSLLDRIGLTLEAVFEVRLRPAQTDLVDTPPDILAGLHHHNATTQWDRLTAGNRRGLIYKISTAKTDATRAKRIAALVSSLLAAP